MYLKADVRKRHLTLKIKQHGHRIILLIHQLGISDHWKHVPVSNRSILGYSVVRFLCLTDTGRPYVYLPCYPNSSWGDEPYFSNCIKPVDPIKKIRLNENPYRNLSIDEIATVNSQFSPSDDLKSILFL